MNACVSWAGVAQLVEYKLPKLGVAGSTPVARSIFLRSILIECGPAAQQRRRTGWAMWSTFFLDFQTAMQTSPPSSRTRSEEIRRHLDFLVLPVVHGLGLELWGLEYLPVGRKALIRIYIDADGGATIDQCAMVSRQLGPALEIDERLPGPFTLEVSSPGLERRFFQPEQLQGYLGRIVQAQLNEPLDGRKSYRGELSAVDGMRITLVENNVPVSLDWDQIKKAHLVHTF